MSYNRKAAALELQQNKLLADLLQEMRQDVLDRFPAAPHNLLPELQIEILLVEKLATRIDNEITTAGDS